MLAVRLPVPALSWTVASWIRPPAGQASSIFLAVSNGQLAVDVSGSAVILAHDGLETARIVYGPLPVDRWSHFAIAYNSAMRTLEVFVDGSKAASASAAAPALRAFAFGGDCAGYRFSDLVAYRVPLRQGEVAELVEFQVPRRSLEFWSRLASSPSLPSTPNEAWSASSAQVSGGWSLVGDVPGGACLAVPEVPGTNPPSLDNRVEKQQ